MSAEQVINLCLHHVSRWDQNCKESKVSWKDTSNWKTPATWDSYVVFRCHSSNLWSGLSGRMLVLLVSFLLIVHSSFSTLFLDPLPVRKILHSFVQTSASPLHSQNKSSPTLLTLSGSSHSLSRIRPFVLLTTACPSPASSVTTSKALPRPPRLLGCVFLNRANVTCRWEAGDASATRYTLQIQRIPGWD